MSSDALIGGQSLPEGMDAFDLVYALAGFVVGAVAVAVLVEARTRSAGPVESMKLTSTWRLAELGSPLVVARDVEADVPTGSRIVASGTVASEAFAAAEVRQVPHVAAEYAIDAGRRRVLLFLGGVRPGAQAILSVDPAVVARLEAEATALWERADPYVERRTLSDAAGRHGLVVETQGIVQEVIPYQGAYLLRLEDGGQVLGVHVDKEPSELRGQRVVVRGKMLKDKGGYPMLKASDLRRLQ
ncbi:MAG: hypothetical protein AABY18_08050 [Candidatus Thermoplasmatota archaeon]